MARLAKVRKDREEAAAKKAAEAAGKYSYIYILVFLRYGNTHDSFLLIQYYHYHPLYPHTAKAKEIEEKKAAQKAGKRI